LHTFLDGLPLEQMRPEAGAVVHAGGGRAWILAGTGVYAMYIDGQGEVELTLRLKPAAYTAEWVDRQSGAVMKRERVMQGAAPVRLTTPSMAVGIALRLKRVTGSRR
jgi:DNA-dependent RNA polymerase auxiliary subunit epsilon